MVGWCGGGVVGWWGGGVLRRGGGGGGGGGVVAFHGGGKSAAEAFCIHKLDLIKNDKPNINTRSMAGGRWCFRKRTFRKACRRTRAGSLHILRNMCAWDELRMHLVTTCTP